MNRIDPALFSACFTDWVRETWPDRPDFVAIDGKTPDQVRGRLSRRSNDPGAGAPPLHLDSAIATTRRLVLGQEAVDTTSNQTPAIPPLLERLAAAGPNGSGEIGSAHV